LYVLFTKYYSDNQIKKNRLARHVACMGRREVQKVVVVNLKEGDHLEDPGIEGG
jgi:hypothetical protein